MITRLLFTILILISSTISTNAMTPTTPPPPSHKTALLAGGCFWCMEKPFDQLEGVISTISGYTGGNITNPTYEEVSSGSTGHVEVLQVTYDPNKVTYQTLLDIFWQNIDPLDATGQFCDKGQQYRSVIFYHDETEKTQAETSKDSIAKALSATVATDILPASTFYPAEDYHQDYYQRNPIRYRFYRSRCGRDKRLEEIKKQMEKNEKM